MTRRVILAAVLILVATPALAQEANGLSRPRIKDIAGIKGPQDNFLTGIGLVFGLPGTGDGDTVLAADKFADLLEQLHKTRIDPKLLKAKNVAVVYVTATLPPYAVKGRRIDVELASAGSAKSIEGGRLTQTPLRGPDGKVWAVAQGAVAVDVPGTKVPTGRILEGAVTVEDLPGEVAGGGDEVYLVLKEPDFTVAAQIAQAVNDAASIPGGPVFGIPPERGPIAFAQDARTVVVEVPEEYQAIERMVPFLAALEQVRVETVDVEGRVVINTASKTVVVNGPVTISEVAISHGTLNAALATPASVQGLGAQGTPLQDLINALNAIHATPDDLIQIIKAIDRAGALHGRLVVM